MRIRALAVIFGLTAALVGPLACSPPQPEGPCTEEYVQAQMDVLDRLNDIIARLTIHETFCISTRTGHVYSNKGTQEQHNVGWTTIFSGGTLEEIPANDASGPTGPLTSTRTFTAHWHLQLNYTVWGYGFHVSKGDCWMTGHAITFFTLYKVVRVTGECSQVNVRTLL